MGNVSCVLEGASLVVIEEWPVSVGANLGQDGGSESVLYFEVAQGLEVKQKVAAGFVRRRVVAGVSLSAKALRLRRGPN